MATRNTRPKAVDFGRKTAKVRLRRDTGDSSDMRMVLDCDGRILYLGEGIAKIAGTTPKDGTGRALDEVAVFEQQAVPADDRAVFNSLSRGHQAARMNPGDYTLLLGPDRVPVQFRIDRVQAADGTDYIVIGGYDDAQGSQWTDMIDRIAPNRAASRQPAPALPVAPDELQTAAAVDSDTARESGITDADVARFSAMSRDLLCVMERDGSILRANDHFTRRFGRFASTASPSFIDMVYPDDRAPVRQYLQSLAVHDGGGRRPLEFETRMQAKDAAEPVWTKWSVYKDNGLLYGLGWDVTATKMNEQALIRREQELSEAQALANMGHWRWRVGDTVIEWSDQIYTIFGVDRDDFVPTLDNANRLLHRRDIGRMMQAFQRAIIEQNNYEIDFRVLRADDTVRYVRCEGRCELDADGDAVALYGVMQDVTDQTEHEMALREAKDAAEQAYAAKSRFLANMSHELRTPLNAIIGFSDMIERQMLGPLGAEKYADYAKSIRESGEHLLDLITDILDMSKIEAGKYELDLERLALGTVIQTAVRMIESRAGEGLLTLDCTVTAEGPHIVADRRAVMQILLNVLSNAVKFTEPGGSITVSCDEFDNHVSVRIADTGIGIPANKLSAVMRPFEQVSTALTRNHEGSGLGLAITKELAEMHNGLLSLESVLGEGTTATLRLPRDASRFRKSDRDDIVMPDA